MHMLARDSTKYTGICIGPIIIFRLAEKTRIIPKSLNFLQSQRTYFANFIIVEYIWKIGPTYEKKKWPEIMWPPSLHKKGKLKSASLVV